MDELLEQLASESGVPATLLERAAAARATALGVSTEDLVRQWAGVAGDAPPAPAAAPAPEPPPAATEAVAPVAATAAAPPEEPAAEAATAEVLEPTAPPPEPSQAEEEPEVEEPEYEPLGGVPGWLAAAFALVPIIAVVANVLLTVAGSLILLL